VLGVAVHRSRYRFRPGARTTGCDPTGRSVTQTRKVRVGLTDVPMGRQPDALSGLVAQGDERLPLQPTAPSDMPPDRVVRPRIPVLVPEPPVDPRRGVPLLPRSLFVPLEDRVDHRLQRPQLRRPRLLTPRIRPRLRLPQHLPDLAPRVMKRPSDLPDAHPVPMRSPDPSLLFRRQHPYLPRTR